MEEPKKKGRSDPSEIRRRIEQSQADREPVPFDIEETTGVIDVALQTVRKSLVEQQKRIDDIGREISSAASTITKIPT